MQLEQYKALIFDFDGVIVDSVPIRTQAFKEVLKDYPQDKVQEFLEYHLANGGISRFVKLQYFFNHILHKPLDLELQNTLLEQFSVIAKKELESKKYLIKDTLDFITSHYQRFILYIASGSQQDELRYLCDCLEITRYFRGIYGSPIPKSENVATILKGDSLSAKEYALIGDSINDGYAAHENGVKFFGYNNTELIGFDGYIESFKDLEK